MPLAERDINTQHHLPLTRCKRLPASRSVTDENAALSPTIPRAKESPTTNQQRFLAPTKASVAKNTPPPPTDRTRVQPASGKSISSPHGSKLPRRNAATPTPKSPLSPPISKWHRCVASDCVDDSNSRADPSSSPYPSPFSENENDHSLVCRATLSQASDHNSHAIDRSRRLATHQTTPSCREAFATSSNRIPSLRAKPIEGQSLFDRRK